MPHFGMLLIGILVAKYFFQITTTYNFNHELTDEDNSAFGVGFAGYLIGSVVALTGTIYGSAVDLGQDAIQTGLIIVITIILMRISVMINDWAILHSFSIQKEISKDRNVGVGFVLAGASIATGFMLNGVLNGQSASLTIGLRDIVIYWVLGQALLIIGGLAFQWMTKYDVHKVIGDEDNMPAGVSFGGFLVAIGLIVRNALYGATSNVGEELIVTAVFALFGMIMLVFTRFIIDRLLLPKSPLTKEVVVDRNPAAGALASISFIVVAIVYSASINPHAPVQPAVEYEVIAEPGAETEEESLPIEGEDESEIDADSQAGE